MQGNVYKYFLNLDKAPLKRYKGLIIENEENFDTQTENTVDILGRKFYTKFAWTPDENLQQLATCNMLNNTNILTPPIYLSQEEGFGTVHQLCEDVHRPEFIECLQPSEINEYRTFYDYNSTINNTWEILYNRNLRDYFLTFMTEDCFNQIISLFSIDDCRSEMDRHFNNYFLYKLPGSNKFNGVIAIDHDLTYITKHLPWINVYTKDNFYDFLRTSHEGRSPIGTDTFENHVQNITNIRKAITDGVMPLNSIIALANSLNYDFPGMIKKMGKKYHCSEEEINLIYDPISYLWEYNRNELKKELSHVNEYTFPEIC